MSEAKPGKFLKYEAVLNEALRDVVLEIRSVTLADLTSFIHSNKFENVADIFDSATELYFKPETFKFSYSGEIKLGWFGMPMVSLDLEFCAVGLDIFFKLEIDALSSRTQFYHAKIGDRLLNHEKDMDVFSNAIQSVKINSEPFLRTQMHLQ